MIPMQQNNDNRDENHKFAIQLIDLQKSLKLFNQDENPSHKSPEEVMQKIVDEYNDDLEESRALYAELALPGWNAENLNSFQIKAYYQVNQKLSNIGKALIGLGATPRLQETTLNYIIFLYRKVKDSFEIFALTSGAAYHSIKKLRDFNFPLDAIKRIADPKSLVEKKARPLVGSVLLITELWKAGSETFFEDYIDKLFSKVRYAVKSTSDIFQLSLFPKNQSNEQIDNQENEERIKKKRKRKNQMGVSFGFGCLQFSKKFHLRQYPELLQYLVNSNSRPSQDDQEFDFLDYIRPVSAQKAGELTKELQNQIQKFLYDDKNIEPLPLLDIYYKNYELYSNGDQFKLEFDGHEEEYDLPPSAQEVFSFLKDTLRENPPQNSQTQKFKNVLRTCKLTFFSGSEMYCESLLNFIEGQIVSPDLGVYWRLKKVWFEIKTDYIGRVNQVFQKNLSSWLIRTNDEGFLHLEWPGAGEIEAALLDSAKEELLKQDKLKNQEKTRIRKKPIKKQTRKNQTSGENEQNKPSENNKKRVLRERIFNKKYTDVTDMKLENYFVGDTICPHDIELFDILYMTKDKIYLYQVKEGFDHSTRDACSQIRNAARALSSQKVVPKYDFVDSFYRMATDPDPESSYRKAIRAKLTTKFENNLKDFRQIFKKKIVFVFAFIEKTQKDHSAEEEADRKVQVLKEDLEGCCTTFQGKGKEVFDELVANNYLSTRGFLTTKFFGCARPRFKIKKYNTKDNDALYTHLLKYKSCYQSTIAKLELNHLHEEITKLGFDFKICQIKRKVESSKEKELLEELPETIDIPNHNEGDHKDNSSSGKSSSLESQQIFTGESQQEKAPLQHENFPSQNARGENLLKLNNVIKDFNPDQKKNPRGSKKKKIETSTGQQGIRKFFLPSQKDDGKRNEEEKNKPSVKSEDASLGSQPRKIRKLDE